MDKITYLTVPYENKSDAKFHGCLWSPNKKLWYIHKENPHHDKMVSKYEYKVEKRIYLIAKYEDRLKVKALGAKYDRDSKMWYLPYGRVPGCEPYLSTSDEEDAELSDNHETITRDRKKPSK